MKVGARCLLYAVAGTGAVGIVVFALLPAAMTLVLVSHHISFMRRLHSVILELVHNSYRSWIRNGKPDEGTPR